MPPFMFLALTPAYIRKPAGLWIGGAAVIRLMLWAVLERQGVELPSYTNEAIYVLWGFVAFVVGAHMYMRALRENHE